MRIGSIGRLGLLLAFLAPAAAASAPAPAPVPGAAAPQEFTPLDLPDWVIIHTPGARELPWILIVDDPQCPFCMQLLLALEKERELNDPEISRALVATLPYPLPYHDQSAHIVADALCLERSRADHPWSAASYLDWLIVAPWKAEAGWKTATLEDLEKDGGFFDSKYESHRVQSSRRREFQTGIAKVESACETGGCRGDAECEKLCTEQRTCRAACPAPENPPPAASPPGSAGTTSAPAATAATSAAPDPGPGAGASPSARDKCLSGCAAAFVSKRYRQYSKIHSTCLLEEGEHSAHAKVAAAFAWAVEHKVPGTPTVYAGHPSIGFQKLGDSDQLSDFLALLRRSLAEARTKLRVATS